MANNFHVGATVENVNEDSDRYGEQAEVLSFSSEGIAVRYEDGYIGKAKTASRYYSVVRNAPCGTGVGASISKPMDSISSVIRAVKRATMSADKKALIDSGLMNECGDYTCTALAILAQAAATADVALGENSVLIQAARSVMEEKKEKKG